MNHYFKKALQSSKYQAKATVYLCYRKDLYKIFFVDHGVAEAHLGQF